MASIASHDMASAMNVHLLSMAPPRPPVAILMSGLRILRMFVARLHAHCLSAWPRLGQSLAPTKGSFCRSKARITSEKSFHALPVCLPLYSRMCWRRLS